MRKLIFVSLFLVLFGSFAAAQVPTAGNVFFGYSYYNSGLTSQRGGLNGWNGSLEGKVFPHIGIVADLSTNYGSLNFPIVCPVGSCPPASVSTHVTNVMFGPRVSASFGKLRPFVEGMVGIGHVTTGGNGSDTSFASAIGGGVDYHLVRLLALRFEADYVRTDLFHTTLGNVRFSTGLAFHF